MADTPKQVRQKNFQRTRHFVNSNEYRIQKRTPRKKDNSESVIYVSNKSNIKALLDKCDTLIKNDHKEITICCMGAAIQRGILLALQLCEKHVTFQVSVNTSTVELTDDLEPITDEADYEILKRNNSALQIRVFCSLPSSQ
ncbi:hypothetical protein ILUMI_25603 [Ignelater luminosus]|uniref:Ribonuclease P protein subunit p20 n=1 Tax=Ignelater luminosus TaxID=2038154 RepID=A0A8K0C4M2_IGNLU|nr:hypothetical protein ILUMI_25603 [Ignelater luminosus]